MRKFVLVVALVAAVAAWAKGGEGLLWKVSGNGAEKASYVFGSLHLAPAEFVDSVPGLRAAIAEAQAVYGEVEKDELTSSQAQQKMMAYAMAPADSTLSKLLTPDELAEVDALMAMYTGQPGMIQMMDMLKPAILSTQIAVLQISSAFPELNAMQPFDAVVMGIGEADGKEIGGLETLESQMELLFGAPLTVQAQDLLDTVRNNDKQIEQTKALTEAYLAQDLDAITAISTDPEMGVEPENLDRLIYSRNRAWAEQLVKLMPEKPMLVIVGAAHLGGEQGLLNLLKQNGFTVEPVNE